jgi:hypothetical protein
VIEDLDITQNGTTNPDVGDQCIYFHSAHDVVIRHNNIHDCNGGGLVGNARDLLVDGNQITRCAVDAVDLDSGGAAISMSGTRIVVQNNRIVRNAAYGVSVVAEPWDPVNDPNHPEDESYANATEFVVTNNVFAFNQNRSAIIVWKPGATGGIFQNNIFAENAQDGPLSAGPNGIDFSNCGTGHVVRNNLYFGTAPTVVDSAGGASYVESDALEADPSFVDPEGTDFRLMEDSPAIDAGISDMAPALDTECTPRPQGADVDIGPYEVVP